MAAVPVPKKSSQMYFWCFLSKKGKSRKRIPKSRPITIFSTFKTFLGGTLIVNSLYAQRDKTIFNEGGADVIQVMAINTLLFSYKT
jgi:hypothetical protein